VRGEGLQFVRKRRLLDFPQIDDDAERPPAVRGLPVRDPLEFPDGDRIGPDNAASAETTPGSSRY
jgi:hypothetical protein